MSSEIKCEHCNGEGHNWTSEFTSRFPCEHCRGRSTLSAEELSAIVQQEERSRIRAQHSLKRARREIDRLRLIIDGVAQQDRAWSERRQLLAALKSQRKAIAQMADRISELGGGRSPEIEPVGDGGKP